MLRCACGGRPGNEASDLMCGTQMAILDIHVHNTIILYTVYIVALVYYSGCALSAGCQASVIGDHMCSVGSGLQCQCLSPRVAEGNRCLTGTLTCEH